MEVVVQHDNTVIVSERNVDIIKDYSNGIVLSKIAKKNKLSVRSVEAIIAKLKSEFKCKNITHLVATFLRKGLIK
jgi:DNA-binding NarL/FixJ family response regulator